VKKKEFENREKRTFTMEDVLKMGILGAVGVGTYHNHNTIQYNTVTITTPHSLTHSLRVGVKSLDGAGLFGESYISEELEESLQLRYLYGEY
jgi:hypothetical protein